MMHHVHRSAALCQRCHGFGTHARPLQAAQLQHQSCYKANSSLVQSEASRRPGAARGHSFCSWPSPAAMPSTVLVLDAVYYGFLWTCPQYIHAANGDRRPPYAGWMAHQTMALQHSQWHRERTLHMLATRTEQSSDAAPVEGTHVWKQRALEFFAVMFFLGATIGPAVDGIHGQVHLVRHSPSIISAHTVYIRQCTSQQRSDPNVH